MNSLQKFSVNLPGEMASELEEKVRSGAYASVEDALLEGARDLLQREAEIDHWLRREIVAGHEEFLADPSAVIPADSVLDRMKARRAARRTA
jgi:Arc/MetJ-type ribon-helix-helix transcriptional regulator